MKNERPPRPDDPMVWSTIRKEPDDTAVEAVWASLSDRLETTPQLAPRIITWPWSPALPGVSRRSPRIGGRAVTTFATVALVALVVLIAAVAVVTIGRRVPPPFGLAAPGLIAFDDGGDVVVVDQDGTRRRELTSGPAVDVRPTWSLDGRMIAYWSVPRGETVARLMVMDADGSHPRIAGTKELGFDVSGRPVVDWFDIAWSPDGRFLAFTGGVIGRPQVGIARADGSGSSLIGDPDLLGQTPAWSPDGTKLAFRGGRADRERGVYVMAADGTDIVRVTTPEQLGDGGTFSYFLPTWSPDGTRILYSKMVGEQHPAAAGPFSAYRIIVVDVVSGIETPLSDDQAYNDYPVWSPDGSRVAYMQWKGTDPSYSVVIGADGSNRTTLPIPGWNSLHWSPDGQAVIADATDVSAGIVVSSLAGRTMLTIPLTSTVPTAFGAGAASWQRLAP
jgi:Tol biopolymer transport system component